MNKGNWVISKVSRQLFILFEIFFAQINVLLKNCTFDKFGGRTTLEVIHQTLKKFQKESPAIEEYYFNAYVVKKDKSDTMHCECLCLAGAVAPSFNCLPTARLFSERDPRNSS